MPEAAGCVPERHTGPLQGWRILEIADGPAASFCGKILSDLGAEVVMIEAPGGHPLRQAEPRRANGVSGRFLYLSTGKRSVVAEKPSGELIGASDLIITDDPGLAMKIVYGE